MGEKLFCNISVKKVKYKKGNHKSLTNLGVHLYRTHKEDYNLADKNRRNQNEVLISMEQKTLAQSLNSFLKTHDLKTRNSETVQAYQVVFSIPKNCFDNPKLIEEFKKQVVNFVNSHDTFKGNCLTLVYHGDETQPHIQGVFVPRSEGKLNFKKLLGGPDGPQKLHKLHDEFSHVLEPLGLSRGDGTHTRGLTQYQYEQAVTGLTQSPTVKPVPLVQVPAPTPFAKGKTIHALETNVSRLQKENSLLRKANRKSEFYYKQNDELRKSNAQLKKRLRQKEQEKMKYTNEQLDNLRAISCVEVLETLGFSGKPEGETTRFKTEDMNIVINSTNKFVENKNDISGGGAIDLLYKVFNYTFKDAISYLRTNFGLDNTARVVMSTDSVDKTNLVKQAVKKSTSEMPIPKPNNINKVYDYLVNTRKISKPIVEQLVNSNLLYADKNNNCVFTNENATFAFIRGTYEPKRFVGTRGDIDFLKYQFGKSENDLFIFESAIDALSFRTMNPDKDGLYIVTNGSALINRVHELCDKFQTVHCCFDNDEQGEKFCAKIKESTVSTVEVIKPVSKDFNEDLKQWQPLNNLANNHKLKI